MCSFSATDTSYEIVATVPKLPSVVVTTSSVPIVQQNDHHNSLSECVDDNSNKNISSSKIVLSNDTTQSVAVTSVSFNSIARNSEQFTFSDYSKSDNQAGDTNCVKQTIVKNSYNNLFAHTDENNTVQLDLSATETQSNSPPTKFIVNNNNSDTIIISNSNNNNSSNKKDDNSDISIARTNCINMVQQHHGIQRKPAPAYDATSVIIENVNSRAFISDPIITSANIVDSPQSIYAMESPTSSPIRYSQLQTVVPNNHQYLTNNNNNNENCTNWNYDLSLDLRQKPADIDKTNEKQQHHHQHIQIISDHSHIHHNQQHHTAADNELIEQRTIITTTTTNNHNNNNNNSTANHYSDIQPVIIADHYQNISVEPAAMRSGPLSMYSQTFATSSNNNHHTNQNGTSSGGANTTNSAINEMIADTLKDENCTMVETNGTNSTTNTNGNNSSVINSSGNGSNGSGAGDDENTHYLSLTSPSVLHHLKDNIYTTNSSDNSVNLSHSATVISVANGETGNSRSPTDCSAATLAHDEYEAGLQSYANLTSAHSGNNRESLYNTSTSLAESVHSANIHAMSAYESSLHSGRYGKIYF